MADDRAPLHPRLRRVLELAYAVEGVVAAQIWQSQGSVALGVRPGAAENPAELLARVEAAVSGLRDPGETWDFGILDDVVAEALVDGAGERPDGG